MATLCPSGHSSSEPDYCSHCGIPIQSSPVPQITPPPTAPHPRKTTCPLCQKTLLPADFPSCLLCGYILTLTPLPLIVRVASAPTLHLHWSVTVSVDPSLDRDPNPAIPCPREQPEVTHEINSEEWIIGRHDAQPPPSLPLRDPGISRRHAALLQQGTSLWLLDLGSTNGTELNGTTVEAWQKLQLQSGDEITLGRWTRIQVRHALS